MTPPPVLKFAPIAAGSEAEARVYRRVWLAEHHNRDAAGSDGELHAARLHSGELLPVLQA